MWVQRQGPKQLENSLQELRLFVAFSACSIRTPETMTNKKQNWQYSTPSAIFSNVWIGFYGFIWDFFHNKTAWLRCVLNRAGRTPWCPSSLGYHGRATVLSGCPATQNANRPLKRQPNTSQIKINEDMPSKVWVLHSKSDFDHWSSSFKCRGTTLIFNGPKCNTAPGWPLTVATPQCTLVCPNLKRF